MSTLSEKQTYSRFESRFLIEPAKLNQRGSKDLGWMQSLAFAAMLDLLPAANTRSRDQGIGLGRTHGG
jgi:hypothetical protein